LSSVSEVKEWSFEEVIMMCRKVRGDTLDRLCRDKVFYIERGNGGFLVVEGCSDAYFTKLSPTDLIELGTELIQAGTDVIKATKR
jgi:hypothetical protein